MSDDVIAGAQIPSSLRSERPADDSPPAIRSLDSEPEAKPEPPPVTEPEYLPEPPSIDF